jgi:uncharacterized surface protein with fasciclin (FAS1) repeats
VFGCVVQERWNQKPAALYTETFITFTSLQNPMRALLLLPALALLAAPAALAQSYGSDYPTLTEIAVQTDDLSTLATAVTTAGLADALAGDGPLTVFAPTNAAFGALPEGTVEALLQEENREQLSSILLFHVVPGKLRAADLSDGQVLETLAGDTLTVRVTDAGVTINGVTVVAADVNAKNGVAHVIDGVLLPPAPDTRSSY